MRMLADMVAQTFKMVLVAVLVIGSLGTVIVYQNHVVSQQRDLIRQMVKNPNCLMPEGK